MHKRFSGKPKMLMLLRNVFLPQQKSPHRHLRKQFWEIPHNNVFPRLRGIPFFLLGNVWTANQKTSFDSLHKQPKFPAFLVIDKENNPICRDSRIFYQLNALDKR